MPFTRKNLKRDLEDIGSKFDGAPDLEFRAATKALGLEQSGLCYQRVPPGYPPDHPDAELLKMRDVVFGRQLSDEEVLSPDLPRVLSDGWAAAMPVLTLLASLRA